MGGGKKVLPTLLIDVVWKGKGGLLVDLDWMGGGGKCSFVFGQKKKKYSMKKALRPSPPKIGPCRPNQSLFPSLHLHCIHALALVVMSRVFF